MLPPQINYIAGWKSRVESKGFVAGVYCSGMKVKKAKGQTITTADDIHERAPVMAYFVYNDACPPSPGCAYLKNPPEPSQSGYAGRAYGSLRNRRGGGILRRTVARLTVRMAIAIRRRALPRVACCLILILRCIA